MTDKTELAEERTDFAEDRTVLANERTYAGWLRTGMAAVALGLGFQALFDRLDPVWVPKAIATVFFGIGILIFLSASNRAQAVMQRLHAHEVQTVGTGKTRLISWLLVTATAALVAALWLLEFKGGG